MTGDYTEWEYRGRKCVVIWVRNHYCAYVETKLRGLDYTTPGSVSPESLISAHGGIAFSGSLSSYNGDSAWYFGIDFAHSGDYVEGLYPSDGKKWSLEEVQEECQKLADEVIRYENFYESKILPLLEEAAKEFDADYIVPHRGSK